MVKSFAVTKISLDYVIDNLDLQLLSDDDVNMFPSAQEPHVSNDDVNVSTDITTECCYAKIVK